MSCEPIHENQIIYRKHEYCLNCGRKILYYKGSKPAYLHAHNHEWGCGNGKTEAEPNGEPIRLRDKITEFVYKGG